MELYPRVVGHRRDCGGAAVVDFHLGGLGLRSAVRSQSAAYWASWADSFPRIREKHPRIVDFVGVALFQGRFPERSNLQATATCREQFARGQRPADPQRTRTPLAMFG